MVFFPFAGHQLEDFEIATSVFGLPLANTKHFSCIHVQVWVVGCLTINRVLGCWLSNHK